MGQAFARIRGDARHRDLLLMLDEPVSRRGFAAWDMACTDPGGSLWLQLSTAQWETSLLLDDERHAGFALLERAWTRHRPRRSGCPV